MDSVAPTFPSPIHQPFVPQLPTEIWETVIDDRAGGVKDNAAVAAHALFVCCMVCRTWYPQASWHLSHYGLVPTTFLWRRSDIEFAVKAFKSFPFLRSQVRRLDIKVADDNQSWVSLALVSLVVPLATVRTVVLKSVDFGKQHPQFLPHFVLLCDQRRSNIVLEQVSHLTVCRLSKLSQKLRPPELTFAPLDLIRSPTLQDCHAVESELPSRSVEVQLPPHIPQLILVFTWKDLHSSNFQWVKDVRSRNVLPYHFLLDQRLSIFLTGIIPLFQRPCRSLDLGQQTTNARMKGS